MMTAPRKQPPMHIAIDITISTLSALMNAVRHLAQANYDSDLVLMEKALQEIRRTQSALVNIEAEISAHIDSDKEEVV